MRFASLAKESFAFTAAATRATTWKALTSGLPQENAYEVILRDALCSDTSPEGGVYFGTRNGKLYGSQNNGDSWEQIQNALPEVLCVKAF